MKQFKDFNFQSFLNEAIEELKFKEPTPVQAAVIPIVYKRKDIIGISQTGTGKTHAFLLPIFDLIDPSLEQVQAVITAPTRELAAQIADHAKFLQKSNPDITYSLVIGGSDKQKAIDKLSVQPHIVIGTPGRIKDLALDELALKITTADIFVIDEADMTLEFGYLEDIDAVIGQMKETLQMMVFSATIPVSLRPFLKKYMKNPKIIEIDENKPSVDNIKHILVPTRHKERMIVLENIMKGIDPYICLIFTNTRKDAMSISKELRNKGFKIGEIHGDLEPRERRQMMRRIKDNEYQYIVATDIAARGIDIDGASHVISMDFPDELDYYIHRSGRGGRGKYTGTCYSLYDTSDQESIKLLEKKGITFETFEFRGEEWKEVTARDRREKRVKKQSDIEVKISKIIKKPTKVKPGYKKKRQWEINELVRKEKRATIQKDIRKRQKERAKEKQREDKSTK